MPDQPKAPRWDEPEQAPPWEPDQGPAPRRHRYPPHHQPALGVLVNGRWRVMPVHTRLDYADGRVAYQGDIYLPEGGGRPPGSYNRVYWWPQPGRLRVERGPE